MSGDYQLVQLANGAQTLFSASYGEKLHPGLGPQAEAELLYVRQLKICERLQNHAGEFVIWDIGLGAAANAIAALRATRESSGELRLVSFDNTTEPLEFALKSAGALGYVAGYEEPLAALLREGHARFQNGKLQVYWEFHLGDFPALLKSEISNLKFQRPHAIFFDAFSPAKNPAMWTLPVFENLFRVLEPARSCALTTYSRSTLIRATLLLAGFFVGVGHATGMKEETTIAANTLDLIAEPLGARWLERAARSDSAEPLREPVYSRARLAEATSARLRRHPQFIKQFTN
jgi:tRNA U34 5-methylaminomethyl-2-thiouridine-forming methyltransferase MnmC